MKAKLLYCYLCHTKADQIENGRMAHCPIHGWMPINLFHEGDDKAGFGNDETKKADKE